MVRVSGDGEVAQLRRVSPVYQSTHGTSITANGFINFWIVRCHDDQDRAGDVIWVVGALVKFDRHRFKVRFAFGGDYLHGRTGLQQRPSPTQRYPSTSNDQAAFIQDVQHDR